MTNGEHEYGLYDRLNFGKYKKETVQGRAIGKTIKQIIRDDPDYLLWLLDNVAGFSLDDEAEAALDAELDVF